MGDPKKKVLCVEEDEETCVLITTILSDYEVIGAYDKADALRKASAQKFDVYLLDYHLPDGTGLELCHLIRGFDPDTPILFCTGTGLLTDNQIHKAGAQGIIRKGVQLVDMLEATVAGLLESKK